jgi:hypothetical protein
MSIYTVHEPPLRADETAADPARFRFVRDGFHFWAFVLGPVWMLWHRLWLVFILYVVLSVAMHAGLWFAGAPSGVKFAVGVLISILIGLEAPTLRRWTLARRGWATVGVVAADGAEEAERRFFDAWSPPASHPHWQSRPQSEPFLPPMRQEPSVLGLFPQPGGPR